MRKGGGVERRVSAAVTAKDSHASSSLPRCYTSQSPSSSSSSPCPARLTLLPASSPFFACNIHHGVSAAPASSSSYLPRKASLPSLLSAPSSSPCTKGALVLVLVLGFDGKWTPHFSLQPSSLIGVLRLSPIYARRGSHGGRVGAEEKGGEGGLRRRSKSGCAWR